MTVARLGLTAARRLRLIVLALHPLRAPSPAPPRLPPLDLLAQDGLGACCLMLPPHLPCVCTFRASAPCLYCAGGQALAQPNRLSVLGVAVARPSVRVSGNGGGKRLAGGEGISARLKPRSTAVSVRHAMPRGPTRGIEPRTLTAGAAEADHHREECAVPVPCRATPRSSRGKDGRAGRPQKAAKRQRGGRAATQPTRLSA